MKKTRIKRRSKPKPKKRNLIEILDLDENRAGFIAEEGFNIRHISSSDGDFLKNLIENKNLSGNEKLLVAYKVGFLDGSETTAYSLTDKMNKEFEEVEKKMDKDRENENLQMYS